MPDGTATPPAAQKLGPKPRLEYHAPSALRADPRYQRDLESRASKSLIARIARDFYWPYFGIIVATDNGDGTFCVIDGQHRAEAARRVPGVHAVPVMVLEELTLGEQARAFVAINRNRVALNPMQIHRAAARAGEPEARELEQICAKNGVTIPSSVRGPNDRKRGEVYCIRTLARIMKDHGPDRLDRTLAIVMKAFDGDGVDIRAGVVKAVSLALGAGAGSASLISRLRELDGESWEDRARERAARSGERPAEALANMLMRKPDGARVA